MRRVILFYILMQLLLVACSGTSDNCLCVRGVSQQLAELRKREIKELSYDLFFSLPCEKDSAVRGNIVISFALDARQDVILDFCASPDKVGTIEVNDAAVTCDIRDEHIIIPSQATVAGKNKVHISFVAGNQSLNRNDDYMYTLLVPDRARTLFPCFEQPNLKALFTLSLELPAQWEAVSNSRANSTVVNGDRKTIQFERTEPLSTYLFSFVAGKMQRCERNIGDRVIAAYHRENDPKRLQQLDIIFSQVAASIEWLEHYTGIPYPFAKYDIVILPGFQYGGMEHTGATLYNDATLFLGEHTTPDEELQRALLIAHETAHMWFGDYVTM
ncbi:MAG: aminopeptidase, partial [Bacteroidaceae bacterium]|nr:aminopeptidase [Bacteroidaceae bacterium]